MHKTIKGARAMPAHITHSLFGAAVLDTGICEYFEKGASVCGYPLDCTAFEWGLQGPDLLFFALLAGSRRLPRYGIVMHQDKTSSLFLKLQQYAISIKDTPDFKAVFSYTLGFCCHYVLDKNCHPYVYWLQTEMERQNPRLHSIHHKIESDIDCIIVKRRLGISAKEFRFPAAVMQDNTVCEPISKLYANLLYVLYNITVQPKEIRRSFIGARRYFRFIVDRMGIGYAAKAVDAIIGKKRIVYHLLRAKCYDTTVMNDDHRPWVSLSRPEITRTESFEDLFEHSVREASELMGRMASHILNDIPGHVVAGDSFDNGSPRHSRLIE